MRYSTISSLLILVLCSCGKPKELPPDKYMKWIASEDHGLIHTKRVKNVDIQVKYIPSEYLAYKEFISSDKEVEFDSVWSSYKCGLTFQFTISADKNDPNYGSLMYYQVPSQEELTARTRYLSFNIQEFISLKHRDTNFEPVLSHFEGFDQLGNKLSFQVAFIISEYNCGNAKSEFDYLTFTFDDPFWELGTNHFIFKRTSIEVIPRIQR